MKKQRGLLSRLLFPPHCSACHKLLPFDGAGGESVMCRDCRGSWEKAKLEPCAECGSSMIDCRCMPELLKASDCVCLIRLVGYYPSDARGTVNSIVNNIKRRRDNDAFRFLASQLAPVVKKQLDQFDLRQEKTIVSFCPRGRNARRVNGFDQSECLSRQLAKLLKCDFGKLLGRRRFVPTKNQKTLDKRERYRNAGKSFRLLGTMARIEGKTVILVDDIVTTGASMSVCASLLRDAGAKRVVCVAIATAIGHGRHEFAISSRHD